MLDHGHTAYGNKQSLRQRDLHRHPSRRITRKKLGEEAIDFRKVGGIGDEDRRIYDQIEPAATGPQNCVKILECLPSLKVEAGTNRIARRRVNTWLTRYEQQARRAHSVGIGSNGLQSRNLDDLFM